MRELVRAVPSKNAASGIGASLVVASAAWPFLNFVSQNYSQLTRPDLQSLLISGLGYIIVTLLAYIIAARFYRGMQASIGIAVFTFGLLTYAIARPALEIVGNIHPAYSWLAPTAWICIVAILAGLAASLAWFTPFRIFASVAVFAMFFMAAAGAAYAIITTAPERQANLSSNSAAEPAGSRPNIYFVVLDTYARSDLLKKTFGVDNTGFEKTLSDLGFKIAKKSYSNYPNTRLSLGAMLEMQYVTEPYRKPANPRNEVYATPGRFSPATEKLKGMGYNLVFAVEGATLAFGCGADEYSTPLDKDPFMERASWSFCIPAGSGFTQARLAFLSGTPFLDLMHHFLPKIAVTSMAEIPKIGEYIPFKSRKPTFLLAHILLPHLPGRYDENCNPIVSENQLIAPSEDYAPSLQREFLGNLGCANKQTVELVKRIIAVDPTAMIHITGDHGFYFGLQQELIAQQAPNTKGIVVFEDIAAGRSNPSKKVFEELFAIFNATRLPTSCQGLHSDAISPVNSMRLILTCLGSKDYPLLPNESYMGDYSGHVVRKIDGLGAESDQLQR